MCRSFNGGTKICWSFTDKTISGKLNFLFLEEPQRMQLRFSRQTLEEMIHLIMIIFYTLVSNNIF